MKGKGKQVAVKNSSKRKRDDSDKAGGSGRSEKSRGVLQFFDVAAQEADDDSDFDFSDQDFTDEVEANLKAKEGLGKAHNIPFMPKEEELSDDELEKYLEERYRSSSKYVVYAKDEFETKGSGDKNSLLPSVDGPVIWKVKCMVGRERQAAFCLIQKYVDLQALGTKLKIVSAFAIDHVKGYIYLEAEREYDVLEACKGLCSIYSSKISPVPNHEVEHLLAVQNPLSKVSTGTWVRVKYGNYKGDLAMVVAVDDNRKKATIKLVPRVDLEALAKKLAGGGTVKQKPVVPAPRVISPSELEKLRSHIQVKLDRQSGKLFDTIDGLMLKDGFLFKKVSIESLSYLDIVPSADELHRFKTSKKDEDASDDTEWLSHLYGEQHKRRSSECSKGATKGSEGTSDTGKAKSGTKQLDAFKLHDLVFFGPKDFGVIIGVENDTFQILKDDSVEGAEVVTVELYEIKSGSLEKKFTSSDKHSKIISIKDNVRVLEGPFEGKQGIVRHICRGIIFIYDENQLENGGYFCAKSELCEKVSHSNDAYLKNFGDGLGDTGVEDSTSDFSKKPWQMKENSRDFNSHRQGDRDGAFSIGQSLRIRVGSLKGYLCRVIAIYRSNVTVKLDCHPKIITVKSEELAEVGSKSIRGAESNFTKPFEGFASQGHSNDEAGAPSENDGWNTTSLSAERKPWPDFSASSLSNPFESLNNDADPSKDTGDDPWGSKISSKKTTDGWGKATGSGGEQKSSWTKSTSEEKVADDKAGEADGWGRATSSTEGRVTGAWGTANVPSTQEGGTREGGCSWDSKPKNRDSSDDANGAWGKPKNTDAGGSWGAGKLKIKDASNDATSVWGKTENADAGGSWGTGKLKMGDSLNDATGTWGKPKSTDAGGGWNTSKDSSVDATVTGNKPCSDDQENTHAGGSWGAGTLKVGVPSNDATSAWGKKENADAGDSWGTGKLKIGDSSNEATGTWGKPKCTDAGGSWNTGKGLAGNQQDDGDNALDTQGKGKSQEGSWGSKPGGNQTAGWGNSGGSWNKTQGASGSQSEKWGNQRDETNTEAKNWKKPGSDDQVQSDGWNKSKGFGTDGGSSWSKGPTSTAEGGWNKRKGIDGDGEFSLNSDSQNGQGDFDGGRGSGGRRGRGRGGFRGGNRDDSGRGRSFGRGRSGSWNNQENEIDSEPAFGNSSGWNKNAGWKGAVNETAENQSAGWNGNASNWSNGKGNQSAGWGTKKDSFGNHSDKNQEFSANEAGGVKNEGDGGEDRSNNWNKRSFGSADNAGDWNKEANGDGWKRNGSSGDNPSSGWKRGPTDTGGAVDGPSGWKKGTNAEDEDGSQSNWKKGGFGNRDNPGSWRGGKSFGRGQSSGWNSGQADNDSGGQTDFGNRDNPGSWRGGKSFGRGQSSGWSSGQADDDSGDQTDFSNQGRGFGRGRFSGSNRGGFSSRGGFGNRGGYGDRGRGRRDQSGGGWRGGGTEDAGGDWKSSNATESWKQGGGGRGGRQGWNNGPSSTKETGGTTSWGGGSKETGGTTSWGGGAGGDWKSNNATESWKQGGGGRGGRQSWNNGPSSTNETGGTTSWGGGSKETGGTTSWGGGAGGDWKSSNATESWKQGGGGRGGRQSWNNGPSSTNETGGTTSWVGGAKETAGTSWGGGSKETGGTTSWASGSKETGGTTSWGGGGNGSNAQASGSWNNQGSGGSKSGQTGASAEGGWGKSESDRAGADWKTGNGPDGWKQGGGRGQQQSWSSGGDAKKPAGSSWGGGASSAKEPTGTSSGGGGSAKEPGGTSWGGGAASSKEPDGTGSKSWGGWNSQGSGGNKSGGWQ